MKITTSKLNDNFSFPFDYNGKTYYLNNTLENETLEVSINKEKRTIKILNNHTLREV